MKCGARPVRGHENEVERARVLTSKSDQAVQFLQNLQNALSPSSPSETSIKRSRMKGGGISAKKFTSNVDTIIADIKRGQLDDVKTCKLIQDCLSLRDLYASGPITSRHRAVCKELIKIEVALRKTLDSSPEDLPTANFSGMDLSGMDLSGMDLSGATLNNTVLTRANLKGANLKLANFTGANLKLANLEGANLTEAMSWLANLKQANLKGATLKRVKLKEVNLIGADLTGANLESANLTDSRLGKATLKEADLSGATLERVNLIEADLTKAKLNSANLTGSKLGKATLKEADLSGATLESVNLIEADLTNATLTNTTFEKVDLKGADLTGVNLSDVSLKIVELIDAKLECANLKGLDLTKVNLSGANLTKAKLEGATLTGVNLSGANLTEACLSCFEFENSKFNAANLTGANLEGTDLTEAMLWGATVTKANLKGANLTRAKFGDANLSGADLAEATLESANLTKAHLEGANLTGANLKWANLELATLEGTTLTDASLIFAQLPGATLESANLTGANLDGTNSRRANLTGANLTGAKLGGSNLTGANLEGADLTEATLIDSESALSPLILTGARLTNVKARGIDVSPDLLIRCSKVRNRKDVLKIVSDPNFVHGFQFLRYAYGGDREVLRTAMSHPGFAFEDIPIEFKPDEEFLEHVFTHHPERHLELAVKFVLQAPACFEILPIGDDVKADVLSYVLTVSPSIFQKLPQEYQTCVNQEIYEKSDEPLDSLDSLKRTLVKSSSDRFVTRPVKGDEEYSTLRNVFLTAMCEANWEGVLGVQFINESGVDAGGLTREACTLAFKFLEEEMGEIRQALEEDIEASAKKVKEKELALCYERLGKLFKLPLLCKHKITLPQIKDVMNPVNYLALYCFITDAKGDKKCNYAVLFQQLLKHDKSNPGFLAELVEDYKSKESLESEVAVNSQLALLPEPLKSIYLDKKMFVDPLAEDLKYEIYSFKSGVSQRQKNALLLITSLKAWDSTGEGTVVDHPDYAVLSSVITGMGQLSEVHPLLGKTLVDLSLSIDAKNLIHKTEQNIQNTNKKLTEQLCSYIESIQDDQKKLKDFLTYVTGSPVVPQKGIKVKPTRENPAAQTCFSSISMPNNYDQQAFNAVINALISGADSGFNRS